MRDRPSGPELRAAAAASPRDALAAQAHAIAAREQAAGDGWLRTLWADLAAVYRVPPPMDASGTTALVRRLASDIRAGRFDRNDAARNQALAILRTVTVAKLAVDNPDYLPCRYK